MLHYKCSVLFWNIFRNNLKIYEKENNNEQKSAVSLSAEWHMWCIKHCWKALSKKHYRQRPYDPLCCRLYMWREQSPDVYWAWALQPIRFVCCSRAPTTFTSHISLKENPLCYIHSCRHMWNNKINKIDQTLVQCNNGNWWVSHRRYTEYCLLPKCVVCETLVSRGKSWIPYLGRLVYYEVKHTVGSDVLKRM